MPKTLFDKIWEKHIVKQDKDYPAILYIDAHLIHEVTSPQAFNGLKQREVKVFRTNRMWGTADHNIPTKNVDKPIKDPLSKNQVDTLTKNCQEFNVRLYGMCLKKQGIVHVIGPERGITKPGMTIVCGDSHTSTHGAFGAIAFGIGTSEVEQVMASQCILQYKPKTMNIEINGKLNKGTTAKDIILYIINKLTTSGGTGYFIEFSGNTIRSLSMEARMTICNMSIELGARGGMIAPDQTTFDYVKGREFAPKGKKWNEAVAYWKTLKSDKNAKYDKTIQIDATKITPRITYGTNPGMNIGINEPIPSIKSFKDQNKKNDFKNAIKYMRLESRQGQSIIGQPIDYVFIGSCTNSRIEDYQMAAKIVKGKTKAPNVQVWIVPGSYEISKEIEKQGIADIFRNAGFEVRSPGCSACLAMNEDKIPPGKYCVSTSNRNFEGRQGPGSRTFLASPIMAAAAAIKGEITDVKEIL